MTRDTLLIIFSSLTRNPVQDPVASLLMSVAPQIPASVAQSLGVLLTTIASQAPASTSTKP